MAQSKLPLKSDPSIFFQTVSPFPAFLPLDSFPFSTTHSFSPLLSPHTQSFPHFSHSDKQGRWELGAGVFRYSGGRGTVLFTAFLGVVWCPLGAS